MEFEWDETKDRANRKKHGLSLGDAAQLDWDNAVFLQDERFDYGEEREIAYALLKNRLHVCVFTARPGGLRIISLRKANNREIMSHVKKNGHTPD